MISTQNLCQSLFPRCTKGYIIQPDSKIFRKTPFYSNIYPIEMKNKDSFCYQYSLDITPQLPSNSSALRQSIIRTLHSQLKKLVGMVATRGDMLWGQIAINKPQILIAQFQKNKEVYKFEVLLKPVKKIGMESFIYENWQNMASQSQILNVNTKNMLRKGKMLELSRGSYYDHKTLNENNSDFGLTVWRGYNVSVASFHGNLYLQIDPCSKILREENFLQSLYNDKKKNLSHPQINVKYAHQTILMKYGKIKTYRIDSIQFKMSPRDKFYNQKQGRDISYIQYFKSKYAYKIKDEKQPLIKAKSQILKKRNMEGKERQQYVYLVPEMVSLTGLSQAQKANFKIMKSLDPYTKLHPNERIEASKKIIQKLQQQEESMFNFVSTQPEEVRGYQMNQPQISLGARCILKPKNGNILLRQNILDPHQFVNYIFCYSMKYEKQDQQDADKTLNQLKNAAKSFGINFKGAWHCEVYRPTCPQDWKKQLAKLKTQNGQDPEKKFNFDIIIYLLKKQEETLYCDLKKYASQIFECPSQMIMRDKFLNFDYKKKRSVASKIVLQMNAKVGHPLWKVLNSHAFWEKNTVSTVGIAMSKGKCCNIIAFASTISPDLTQYFSDFRTIKSRDELSVDLFKGVYRMWFQNYYKKNKQTLPNILVIYRQGLNQIQAKQQLEFEIEGLNEAIKVVRQKVPNQAFKNYNPKIVYFLVNKKCNLRTNKMENCGKNAKYINPQPGSVVFQDLSRDNCKSFLLASVSVREGSCSPVQFKIAYQNFDIPLDALAELTYNQCYGYFNWTGSVRVPAALQNANKIAKQYSQIGEGAKISSELKAKLFYL